MTRKTLNYGLEAPGTPDCAVCTHWQNCHPSAAQSVTVVPVAAARTLCAACGADTVGGKWAIGSSSVAFGRSCDPHKHKYQPPARQLPSRCTFCQHGQNCHLPAPQSNVIPVDFAAHEQLLTALSAPALSSKEYCMQCWSRLEFGPGLCDWCPKCKEARNA